MPKGKTISNKAHRCMVRTCRQRADSKKGISLHGFPMSDKARLYEWIKKFDMDFSTPTKTNKVCSLHFDEKDFYPFLNNEAKRLKNTSIPSSNLPSSINASLHEEPPDNFWFNEEDMSQKQMKLVYNYCRMCMKQAQQVLPIFDNRNDPKLAQKIKDSLQIEIGEADKIRNICKDCVVKIDIVYELHHEFQLANEELNSILLKHFPTENQLNTPIEEANEILCTKMEIIEFDVKADTFTDDNDDEVESDSIVPEPVAVASQKCYVCAQMFGSYDLFEAHLPNHFNLLPFNCDKCDNTVIRTAKNLSKHLSLHDENRKFGCNRCEKRYASRHCLTKHIRTHLIQEKKINVIKKTYQCSHCGKEISNLPNLIKHEKKHSDIKDYKCVNCQKSFTHKSLLETHQRIHTGEQPYRCEVCGKGFKQYSGLKSHQSLHVGDKPFDCDICDKSFRTNSLLYLHRKDHNSAKGTCALCDYNFFSTAKLLQHMENEHPDAPNELRKPYECEYCGKRYPQKSILLAHIRKHTGDKPYGCHICAESFTSSTLLRNHQRVNHFDDSFKFDTFICDICGKSFTSSCGLRNHREIHSGKKKHKCEHCGKLFRLNYTLQVHIRAKHTEDRPYECEVCGKRCSSQGSLINHRKSHLSG